MSIHQIHFIRHLDQASRRDYLELVTLLCVLMITIGFIIWIQNGYQTNFVNTLR